MQCYKKLTFYPAVLPDITANVSIEFFTNPVAKELCQLVLAQTMVYQQYNLDRPNRI